MPPALLVGDIGYWGFLGTAVAAAILAAWRPGRAARAVAWASVACGLVMVGGVWAQTGRPPLAGAFESLGFMALVLAVLAVVSQQSRSARPLLGAVVWGAAALLLAILALVPRQVNPDWFLYHYFWNRSFFLCRITAMPLLFFSSLIALAWPGAPQENEQRRYMIVQSRRFLILGTAFFLVGEVSGFYWCLNWRGDYWLWNRNFLESTMIFLLASAALHLPPRLAASPRATRIAYSLPGLLAMGAYLIHQVTEAFL